MISQEEITIVVQGPVDPELTPRCLSSIHNVFPHSPVILSTWKGSDLSVVEPYNIKVLLNDDPGCMPRGADPGSKPNNVNRQIVSARNGVNAVDTKYALKIRADFLMMSDSFLSEFGRYDKYEESYRVFKQRVLVCMFGTRKAKGFHYNLPFHVSDFCSFGLTDDLQNLYNIPLATHEEFIYHKIHSEIKQETYAINRYNAEQTIVINFLRKNNKTVWCEYSTDINEDIIDDSNHYIVNNFVPLSFRRYGVVPMKKHLLPSHNMKMYCDYITHREWLDMYRQYCDSKLHLPRLDSEREVILRSIRGLEQVDKWRECLSVHPKFMRSILRKNLDKVEEYLRYNFSKHF